MRLPREGEPGSRRKQVFDRAVAFLQGLEPGDSPFFLFAHTFNVHDYYLKTEGHARHRDCVLGKRTCPPYVWEKLEDQYRTEIERVDASFGRLLAAVEATQRPTILVVLSDHGEGFDVAGGRIHHGGRLHADLLRVPLTISGPGVEPRLVGDPVSLVDVLPTLLDLVGLPPVPGLDGRSFAAALRGGRFPGRPLLAMEHFYSWRQGARQEAGDVQASPLAVAVIADDRWYIKAKGGDQLFDMRADPAQRTSLAQDPSRGPLGRLAAERLQVHKPEEESQLDEARREQLRSMGYIE
jgi:arylsulfatase A-like enzyme